MKDNKLFKYYSYTWLNFALGSARFQSVVYQDPLRFGLGIGIDNSVKGFRDTLVVLRLFWWEIDFGIKLNK